MPRIDTVYQGAIVTLELLDGHWEVVRHASAVAVLVVRDGLVLGVRQRRPAVDADTWELPAGLIDAGETPDQSAPASPTKRSTSSWRTTCSPATASRTRASRW